MPERYTDTPPVRNQQPAQAGFTLPCRLASNRPERPRARHRPGFAVFAAALACCVQIPGADALASAKRPVDPVAASSDQALLAVRAAAIRRNEALLRRHAAQVPAGHPLAAYTEFWRLRMHLTDPEQSPDPSRLDGEIAHFVEDNPGTVVSRRLLRDWLHRLGQRSVWHLFDRYLAKAAPTAGDSLWCLEGVSRLARGLPPGNEALYAWNTRRELGEDCELLGQQMLEHGQFAPGQLEQRLDRALENRSIASIRQLGRMLGLGADDLALAVESPARALAHVGDSRISVLAIGLLARPTPEQAATHLAGRTDLDATQRSLLWAIIGASAARDLDPQAWQWARQGLDATIGSDTREWLVRAAMLAGDWPGVLRALERLDPSDQSSPRWTYWHARALANTGRHDEAQALLASIAGTNGFYHMLAAEEGGRRVRRPLAIEAPGQTLAPEAIAARPAIQRALALDQLGLPGEARQEWLDGLAGASDAELLAAARLACDTGQLDRCIDTASRMRHHDDWSLRYLRAWRTPLETAAHSHALDPAWVYGLVRQESRFVASARSSAGARGLMQIMPATGRWIAQRRGIRGFAAGLLDRPETSLDFGAWYMRHVLEQLDSSVVLASAAYNAGPGRPLQWRERLPRAIDGALFAELIPFNETRHYVQNVLANTAAYGALLRDEPVALRPLLGMVGPAVPVPGTDTLAAGTGGGYETR